MERRHYNMVLFGGLAVVILFFIVFRSINRSIEGRLGVQMGAMEEALPTEKTAPDPAAVKKQAEPEHALSPSDPAKYQINPQRESALIKNQRYWDVITEKALKQSDVIDRMQEGKVFKGVEKTPAQFQKQLQRIDGRIRDYELKILNDSGDDHARQKLQDLYMIKSSVEALEKTVVAGGGTN